METSLRYGGDSKAIRIHAKENFPLATNKHFQVHAALDTGSGDLSYFSGIIRNFYPELSTTLDVGLQYDKQDKFRYTLRGKKEFPITSNGLLNFIVKGRYDAYKEFKEYLAPLETLFELWPRGSSSYGTPLEQERLDHPFSKRPRGAAELSWGKFNFREDQDVRFKVGYEVFNKVPYFQIRENNWTLNADMKGGWYVRFDL